MTMQTPEEIQEVIENGRRLVREAQAVMAENDRFFEQHNINPQESLEFLRKHAGEAAIQAVEEQVKLIMKRMEQNVEQQRIHAVKARPATKRPRMLRNMI